MALTVGLADASDEVVAQVAAIWARARNRRDGAPPPSPRDCDDAVAGVRRRLALDGAALLLARDLGVDRDDVLGFALFAPRREGVELFYLAVDPDGWGAGVGSALLAAVDDRARASGRTSLELWVIDDNARAIDVYERAGWLPTDELVEDPTSGRVERRFVRQVSDPDGEVRDIPVRGVPGDRRELVDPTVVAEHHVLGE